MSLKVFGRLYWVAFVLSFSFLLFMAGFAVSTFQWFPYSIIYPALHQLHHIGDTVDVYHSDLYVAAPAGGTGVVRYDPERSYNGYTLFISSHFQGAFLIDMQGDVVHRWHLPYEQIWNKTAAVKHPADPRGIDWRDVYLYPNGDLLAVYEGWADHSFGYGLAKMDRNSRPIWTYLDHVHHSVTVGPDGRIYTLAHRWLTSPPPELPEVQVPCTEDFVVVLSPDGKPLKRVSVYGAFARSHYRGMMGLLRNSIAGDTLHTNSVKPLPPGFARSFPQAGSNTVMISMRHLDAIALLDLDAQEITWFMRGPWARQHDARPLPNGDIMLFDDVGDVLHDGHSRVLEFKPNPFQIVWEFPADSGEALGSQLFGAAEELPNGNVLITDSETARLLEVTPEKKVVWEYRSPFRAGDHHEFVAILNSGQRYGRGDIAFQFNRPDSGAHAPVAKQRGPYAD